MYDKPSARAPQHQTDKQFFKQPRIRDEKFVWNIIATKTTREIDTDETSSVAIRQDSVSHCIGSYLSVSAANAIAKQYLWDELGGDEEELEEDTPGAPNNHMRHGFWVPENTTSAKLTQTDHGTIEINVLIDQDGERTIYHIKTTASSVFWEMDMVR